MRVDFYMFSIYIYIRMKVFFTASPKGRKYFEHYYKRIYASLAQQGLVHIDDEIVALSSKELYRQMEKRGKKKSGDLYKSNLKKVKNADIVFFEASFPSLSVGYMINESLHLNKPTVVLYLEDNPPYFLEGNKEEKLIIRRYRENDLDSIIKKTVAEAKKRTDRRFNFFISPNLLNYLNRQSKKEGVTKSTFIRNLIVHHMNKNTRSD